MHFSRVAIFAVTASLSTFASAALVATRSISSKMYFGGQSVQVTPDDVISHLQQNGNITWTASGSGHYTDISNDVWQSGITGAQKTRRSLDLNPRGLEDREYNENLGLVGPYAAWVKCYGWGSLARDSDISNFLTDACDNLVGSNVPPLVVDALRVWQSGQLPDYHDVPSYIRFSAKLLTKGFQYDTTLCQDAMTKFNEFCQNDPGATQGGEIDVSDVVMFNSDPTQLRCNC